jgi:hypothetical protein
MTALPMAWMYFEKPGTTSFAGIVAGIESGLAPTFDTRK